MKLKRLICLCLALVALLSTSALAAGYVAPGKLKPSEDIYCLDNAGVLSDDTKGEIVFSNDLLDKACGAQIVVVTLETTGSDAIDDYTTELFNKWGVGDAKKGNGFLLLLAIGDDDYYALCGDGLQPKLTSGTLKDYFDRYLETDFAAGRYDAGVKKFFEAIFARVADTYNADVTVEQGIAAYEASETGSLAGSAQFGGGALDRGSGVDYDEGGRSMFMGLLVIIGLIVLLSVVSRRRRVRRGVFVSPPPPNVGPGGYRGVNGPAAGGYRGPVQTPRRREEEAFTRGLMYGLFRSSGSAFRSGGSRPSRPSGSFRSSGGSFRSFGGSSRSFGGGSRSFGGGHSSGGGAGRGRH